MSFLEDDSVKSYCLSHKSIGYFSALGGLEIKGYIGDDDPDSQWVYAVSGAWVRDKGYHMLKVYYDKDFREYIRIRGGKYFLDEAIPIG